MPVNFYLDNRPNKKGLCPSVVNSRIEEIRSVFRSYELNSRCRPSPVFSQKPLFSSTILHLPT